ncbi:hypothetical protein BJY04DRAFT_186980 [Aspergillus karnatakaensis]|uniref:uncharacterized protein n=1 Tax=Aspergillus karnatakaensis TaxID=1810916 RepID=UPI003CCD3926
MTPTDCDDFSTAILCALPLETEAVLATLDESYDGDGTMFKKQQGDANEYYTGRIGTHNVVLCCSPKMGKVGAASVISSLRTSFNQIKLVLVVGICGGIPAPENRDQIYLGDVVISDELVEYDSGRQYPDGFAVRRTALQLDREAQSKLARFRVKKTREEAERKLSEHLETAQESNPAAQLPMGSLDVVHLGPNTVRKREHIQAPKIHVGPIASADTVMKSEFHRDKVAQEHGAIGFEMEGAGAWDGVGTCLIVKGVCDYADSHKNKLWQGYAAATGAAAAKAVLSYWEPPSETKKSRGLSMIPVPSDEAFTGREEELRRLENMAAAPDGPRLLALTGLGGIGKTQIAAQFARRMRRKLHKYDVFWIQCTSIESIQKAYMDILRVLKVDDADPVEAKNLVKTHLSERDTEWLLVLDNVDELSMWEAVREVVPKSEHGHVLATTRTSVIADRIAPNHYVLVEEPSQKDATEMLRRRLTRKNLLQDTATAAALLDQLAYLPLAITQATSYINRFTGLTLSHYLVELQKQGPEAVNLLSKDFSDPGNYGNIPNAVITTWLVSFNQLVKTNSLAANYLKIMACVSRHDIPQDFLAPFEPGIEKTEAIGLLGSYSFITTHPITGLSTMHRLVQLSTRSWMRQKEVLGSWLGQAAYQFEHIFPDTNHKNRPLWRKYLPHVISLLNETEERFWIADFLDLWKRAAECLRVDGRYDEALKFFTRIVEIEQKEFADRDPVRTLTTQSRLASTYREQGQIAKAAQITARILEKRRELLGPDHLDTLQSKVELFGEHMFDQKWTEAEVLGKEMVEDQLRVLGPKHPDTLTCMSMLATAYGMQKRKAEEEKLRLHVMRTCQEEFGASHFETLTSMANLALMYRQRRQFADAKELLIEVVTQGKKQLGSDHPLVLDSMKQLAKIYSDLQDPKQAEKLAEQVVGELTSVLGDQHPDTLDAMADLALIYITHGRLQEAEDLMLRVLEGWRKADALPLKIAYAMMHLGGIYQLQGQTEKGHETMMQAVGVQAKEDVLGRFDPQVLENKFVWVRGNRGENGGGRLQRSIMEQVVADAKKRFGEDHPTTQRYASFLAAMQEKTPKAPAAAQTRRRDRLFPKALLTKLLRGSE